MIGFNQTDSLAKRGQQTYIINETFVGFWGYEATTLPYTIDGIGFLTYNLGIDCLDASIDGSPAFKNSSKTLTKSLSANPALQKIKITLGVLLSAAVFINVSMVVLYFWYKRRNA